MRIAMLPHTIILEPIQECVVSSLIGSLAIGHFFSWWPAVPQFLLFHFVYWCVSDYLLAWTMQVYFYYLTIRF
jgi:hypothetical protein